MLRPWMVTFLLSVLAAAPGRADSPATRPAGAEDAALSALSEAWASLDEPTAEPPETLRRGKSPSLNRDGRASSAASPGRGWVRTAASLGGVVALILLLSWGYRLIAAGSGTAAVVRGRANGLIEPLSRAALGPRQVLHLVRVGSRVVLIGATHDGLRALMTIDDPEEVARLGGRRAAGQPDSQLAAFRECLANESAAFAEAGAAVDTDRPARTSGGLTRLMQRALGRSTRK